MAISPAIALGEGNRNLFLIGVMSISPIIILRFFEFDKEDVWLLAFLATIVIFPNLFHPETMRWSTVLYSMMFGFSFIAYKQLLRQKHFSLKNYIYLLRILIYAYFITLLIQQFCVLTGLPVFNVSNYDPTYPWKLNALAAEPSHSGRIVALLMYSYITLKEYILSQKYNLKKEIKKDKFLWLAFLCTMITMGSGTAFLFLGIIFFKFVRFKNLLPVFIIGIAIAILVSTIENPVLERTIKTLIATLTLDEATIMDADHSASIRIVPMIILIKMLDLSSINGWFGHGIDYVGTFLSDFIWGIPEGLTGGGLLALFMEYGFISFSFFVLFSFKTVFRRNDYFNIVFWFLLVVMYGVNNQILWLCLILLFTNNYFFKQTKSYRKIPHEQHNARNLRL
ncbi:hypothetical protein N9936_00505 [bacterium]|nr:hypothetical protein [bacterium]